MAPRTSQYPLDRNTPPVDGIRAPLTAASYGSPELHDAEVQTMFRNEWLFVGPASTYQEPGSYSPVEIAGLDLLITCDSDGKLHAFHNVCAHRGCQLADTAATAKRIVCPYHAWIYTLEGDLASARNFGGHGSSAIPTADPKITGLTPVSIDTWHDLLFINTQQDPSPLSEHLRPMDERIGWLNLSEMAYHSSLEYEFTANWKYIVENFLESYHVPFLHHNLDGYSPATGRYQFHLAQQISGIGTQPYGSVDIDGVRLPTWKSNISREYSADFAEYYVILPNLLLGVMPDHLFAWSLDPVNSSKTIEKLFFFFPGRESLNGDYDAQIKTTLEQWKVVNDEDWSIVQRMHKGSQAESFDRAILSPVMETNIIRLQQYIAEKMDSSTHAR